MKIIRQILSMTAAKRSHSPSPPWFFLEKSPLSPLLSLSSKSSPLEGRANEDKDEVTYQIDIIQSILFDHLIESKYHLSITGQAEEGRQNDQWNPNATGKTGRSRISNHSQNDATQ